MNTVSLATINVRTNKETAKYYGDIYINTHQTLWRTLLLLLLLLRLLNATTSIYTLPAPPSRKAPLLFRGGKQDKSSLGFLIENQLSTISAKNLLQNTQTNKNKMQSMIAQRASAFAHCKVITRQVRVLRVLSSL